jgi:hypothetical protein
MVPDRNIEPAAASVDVIPDVSIIHEPIVSGAFAEHQKKGLRITNYHTTEKE